MHGFKTGLRGIRTLAKYFLEKEKKFQGTKRVFALVMDTLLSTICT